MADGPSLDFAASYGRGTLYNPALDPQSGDGPASGATRFQDILADIMQARDGGDGAADNGSSTVRLGTDLGPLDDLAAAMPLNTVEGMTQAGGAGGPGASSSQQPAASVPAGNVASAAAPTSAAGAAEQPTPITADQLRAIMPQASDEADRYVGPLNQAMATHGINTPTQQAAFLAQISAESMQLHRTVESLDYSAQRMTQVWPRRFPTEAAAAPYAHNPEALANRTYAIRNGNGDETSGDGFRFRGRGLIQVTGRANYRALGFENNPEALAEPQNAADTAAAFWQSSGLNGRTADVLDQTQFDAVSRSLNGGDTGIQDRRDAYQRALDAFGVGR